MVFPELTGYLVAIWFSVLFTLSDASSNSHIIVTRTISSSAHQRTQKFCSEPKLLPDASSLKALSSFPGSGNTWIRFLIQQSSGYLTGSVYHDATLANKGFPGESIANGSMVVIKTHEFGSLGRGPFERAVFLIRNPFKVLLSEFNRQSGGHMGHAPVSKFNDSGWRNYVLDNIDRWSDFTLDWLHFKGPLLITRYENFLTDLKDELARVLTFLQVNFTQDRLDCVYAHRNGWQRRPQHYLPFDPFSMPSSTFSSSDSLYSSSTFPSAAPSLRQVVERKRKKVYQAVNNFLRSNGQLKAISELP